MYPEEGRSAIVAAARAISEMKLGRIDEETTANVGTIKGGTAANVVPDRCSFVGEARSHDEAKLAEQIQSMQDALTFAAGLTDCEVESTLRRTYTTYRFSRDDLPVRLAADALSRCGIEPPTSSPAAPPTRTCSTSAASSASISRTGWPRSTRRTNTSRSRTSKRWWT